MIEEAKEEDGREQEGILEDEAGARRRGAQGVGLDPAVNPVEDLLHRTGSAHVHCKLS